MQKNTENKNAYHRKWYAENKEKMNDYFKKYYQNNKKKYKEFYSRKQSAIYQKWYEKNGRKRKSDYASCIKYWRENNKEKIAASSQVRNAVKSGKIIKPIACSICKRETRLIGHHFNYNKPLFVIWVCSSCHKKIHSS